MTRSFIAHSALGERLKFRSMTGQERISTLFESRVRLVSELPGIPARQMLGEDMTIEVNLATELGGAGQRFISGQVTRFARVGKDDGDMHVYEAQLRPWLWYATRRSDFKIFQFKSVPDIVQEVLAPYGFGIDARLSGSYRSWDYCVQYGETDFDFVSRLMESEGIYYFFAHARGIHQLVLCDGPGSHAPLPAGPVKVPYHAGVLAAQILEQDFIDSWHHAEDIASGHFATDDYDFKKPHAEIDTLRRQPAGHSRDSYEIYDWPGGYTELGDGENYARLRLEQQTGRRESIEAEGNLRHIAPGYLFDLARHPNAEDNRRYLIEAASHDFQENALRVAAAGAAYGESTSSTSYRQAFTVVPDSAPYRVPRLTPRPRTTGPQTAVVVGPAGEEIHTDEYGRIKVQFHWDRYGQRDENASCWIRVSQTWAGSGYGSMQIPRIGQEVIVDFLNGDPDHPIVTGCVYNAAQMPAWELPRHKTQSGIQTHWSKGGGGKHMLRFEDKRGSEHIELSTDHGATHLHMGYLMNQGSEVQRSYGFELRTNEWGSIRADKGLLLTTYTQDFTQRVSRDNPDGHEHMGAALAQSGALMQSAGQAIAATKALVGAMAKGKGQQLMGLAQGVQSLAGAAQAVSALTGGDASDEAGVSGDADPAMADAQRMLDLSRRIDKPVVSIVSPEGQTMISPKPIVVSSGQSVSMRSQSAMTLTTGAQLTQLVAGGMLTQIAKGGQVNVVSGGDIVSHASEGAINLVAKTDASVTSTESNANLVGRKSVLVQAVDQDVFVMGKTSISLICGKSSIVLLEDGTIRISGVKGLVNFTEDLDQRGGKIFLNCEAPVGGESPASVEEEEGVMPAPATAAVAPAQSQLVPKGFWTPTGLGPDVDGVAARSPRFQSMWAPLEKDDWSIEYGKSGGGSYTDHKNKRIVIDGDNKSDPYHTTSVVAHELGHASYKVPQDFSSRQAYITGKLDGEGDAALNQIWVRREVMASTGKDTMAVDSAQKVKIYNTAFEKVRDTGDWQQGSRTIGKWIGTQKTSNTKELYTTYYGGWYDKKIAPPVH